MVVLTSFPGLFSAPGNEVGDVSDSEIGQLHLPTTFKWTRLNPPITELITITGTTATTCTTKLGIFQNGRRLWWLLLFLSILGIKSFPTKKELYSFHCNGYDNW